MHVSPLKFVPIAHWLRKSLRGAMKKAGFVDSDTSTVERRTRLRCALVRSRVLPLVKAGDCCRIRNVPSSVSNKLYCV